MTSTEQTKKVSKRMSSTRQKETSNTRKKKGAGGVNFTDAVRGDKDEPITKRESAAIIFGVLLFVFSVLSLISFISFILTGNIDQKALETGYDGSVHNWVGHWGVWWSDVCINKHFGFGAFLLPVFCFAAALKLTKTAYIRLWKWTINCIFLLVWLSVASSYFLTDIFAAHGLDFFLPGGIHGERVVEYLIQNVGSIGVFFIVVLSFVGYLCYLSAETIRIIKKLLHPQQLARELNHRYPVLSHIIHFFKPVKNEYSDENDNYDTQEHHVPTPEDETPHIITFDDGTSETSDTDDIPADETSSETEYDEYGIPLATVDRTYTPDTTWMHEGNDENDEPRAPRKPKTEKIEDDTDFVIEQPVEEEVADAENKKALEPYDPKLDLEHYRYPTLDLLKHYDIDPRANINMEEQTANKNQIVHVLQTFGVAISSIKATVGPTITLYEITPAPGVRISKIRNLEDDIALSLSALGIRIIAPIPGKGTIGIEVPNTKPQIVSIESILNSKKFQETTFELPMALGKTITNEVFMADLTKMPHLLVAGATGQGKSVGLNAIITSLLYKKHPAELKLVMVDPKKVEFSIYSPIINHFLAHIEDDDDEPIITDVQKVINTLKSLCVEMDTRYDLLKKARARTVKEYNEKFKKRQLNPQNGHKFMPYIVVIIDEFGDLIMTAGKEIELPIARIAQLARAVGIHMIIATQRPTTNIITGTIKANFPARIAFKVSSRVDSGTIIDRPGANQLVGHGDMLFLSGSDPIRVQCAFVDTPEVERITEFIARQQGYTHPFDLPRPPMEDAGSGAEDVDLHHLDPMFADAARLVVATQQGSTSMIQRKFAIGYNRAGRLMDSLEKAGVVGVAQGSKPRDVLIQDENTLETLLASLI